MCRAATVCAVGRYLCRGGDGGITMTNSWRVISRLMMVDWRRYVFVNES